MHINLHSVEEGRSLPGFQVLLEKAIDEADFWHTDAQVSAQQLLKRTYGSDDSLLIIAKDAQDQVQGFGICVPFLDPLSGECRPLLLFLWVAPGLRRHGVARGLLAEIRRLLKEAGRSGLQARVPHGDDALMAMGERWGLVRQWEILADY